MSFDKEEVKNRLEIEDIFELLESLDAEPELFNTYIVAKTICHNGDTHKLYYYENTQLFKCYTGECGTFDIFELISKTKELDLNQAIYFVVNFFNLQSEVSDTDESLLTEDWKIFSRYNKLLDIEIKNNEVILPEIDNDVLINYPQPLILDWEKEGISKEVCDYMGIRYNPINGSILIPHTDENGRLIGIRERTLVSENEKYGKYKPSRIKGKLRNHPLAFNLYGFDKAKNNIANSKTAIVVESEKSVLQAMTYLGVANNICVAVCGSSLSNYQFHLLLKCGINELVVGFDKDFQAIGDDDYYSVVNKLQKIYDKYSPFVNISFLFDKECNQLGYKDSPLDCGKDKFLYLFRNRIVL